MKFILGLLDVIKYVLIGGFIGLSLRVVFDYIKQPEIFSAQSAPWYMGILENLVCCLTVYGSIEIIKWVLKFIFRR